MTRTQKLGLCTWLPEDPVSLAEMNDNFSRLDANGGRSLLLAEASMLTLGGVMAALAHQGGHAVYAERVQVDAFQDADQIAGSENTYYRGRKLQLLTSGQSGGVVYGSPSATNVNAFHAKTLSNRITKDARTKLCTFYTDGFGQLTNLTVLFTDSMSYSMKMKLIIQDTEANQDVLTTELKTFASTSTVSFPVDFRLDPNCKYALYVYAEDRGAVMAKITFTITPLVYSSGSVTMQPLTIPAGASRLELLLHDNGTAAAAALKFDSGEFATLTQSSAKADKVPGGTAATLRRYSVDVPDGAQAAQLKLSLSSPCKIYDYALIAM